MSWKGHGKVIEFHSWISVWTMYMVRHSFFTCQHLRHMKDCSWQVTTQVKYCVPWAEYSKMKVKQLLPEASFGLRVLSLPASVCLCVCVCVYQSRACPRDNSPLIQASIAKCGVHVQFTVQKTLVKNPIVFGGDWPWPSRSNLTWFESRILPHFELVRPITCHSFKLESPNLDQKCILPRLKSLLFLVLIDLDLQGQILT